MLICRYCQIVVDSAPTKTCPKCGTVNALVYNGGVVSHQELDSMMGIGSPQFTPVQNIEVRNVNGDVQYIPGPGGEIRKVANITSYVTGVGRHPDLDLGLTLLLEAQK